MASITRNNHLGVAGGREVVFCHACENEWYRDEHGSLTCPSCESSFIEIVDTGNDPRGIHGLQTPVAGGGSGNYFRRPGSSDSDPDEGDINDHLYEQPPGASPRPSPFEEVLHGARDDRDTANMTEGDAIMRRFTEMLMNDFGAVGAAGGAPGPGGLFPPPADPANQTGPRVHHTTWRAGPFGGAQTRVTITTGNFGGPPDGAAPTFGALFGQLFGNPLMPGVGDPNQRNRGGPEGGVGLAAGIQEILTSLFNPASAVAGDAVFTQEALDRIISNLMEASPQTNAAPPATQSAIDNLEKKSLSQEMLGTDAKAECTICIDEINKGDEVVVLPCKHWYHGECVVLWLKEHNTCPICRKAIEAGINNNNSNNNSQQSQQPPQPQQPHPPSNPSPTTPTSASVSSAFFPFSAFNPPTPHPRNERSARSQRENADRLSAIRNLGGAGGGADSSPRPDAQTGGSNSPSPMTPPGSWPGFTTAMGEGAGSSSGGNNPYGGPWRGMGGASGRAGGESGEWLERQEQQQQQQQQQSGGGGGPLGWLRDHFGRASGNGSGSERDRRR
ncbi:hypothetical protein BT67DRAFT_452237 [Trichocladium antarcticum]|uniref:RING-type E3 ubiquitin transferase n=1 Tax=Trichocladium antarcticum TaxID=1450529 RepID=A0AAN6UD32_9PEZI|nr:hypothetical protein BT67DRAFT_452237 [Trichocladium antarcticum]